MKKNKKEQLIPERAFQLHQKIIETEQLRRALLLKNIIALAEMFDSDGYKTILGGGVDGNWSGYLGEIEIYYSRAQVERWRKVFRCFTDFQIDLKKMLEVPETRLEDIARIIHSKEDGEELLEKAKYNTAQDWKDTLAEFTGKPTSYECQHKDQIFQICSKCGRKHRIDVKNEQEC